MELRAYLEIFRRRWWLVLLLPLVAGGAAFGVSQQLTPVYQATATILVNQTQEQGVVQYNDVLTSERLTNTYAELVKRRTVLNTVVDERNLPLTASGLSEKIDVSIVRNTQLLRISVRDTDPEQAALLSNSVAQAFIRDNANQLGRPGTVTITDEAAVPSSPTSPNVQLNTILGVMLGLMLAGCVVVVLEYLDDTIKTPEGIERTTGLPTLGLVTRFAGTNGDAQAMWDTGPAAEAYRQIRTNVHFARLAREVKTVLVTSASPGEGKSTTAANLARVMAQAGEQVILVDTDLRRPSLHQVFNVPNSSGLTGIMLSQQIDVNQGLVSSGVKNLRLLPSGPLPSNPSEMLTSKKMRELMDALSEAADYVVFDSPPILAVTDASILASMTDGTIVVVEMGKDRPNLLREVKAALDKANARVLGMVINKAKRGQSEYYYYRGRDETDKVELGPPPAPGGAIKEGAGNS